MKGELLRLPTGATALGWHSLSLIPACPKRHQFAVVRGISSFGSTWPDYFSIGLLFHAGRAQWLHDGYRGELWRAALVDYLKRWNNDGTGQRPLHPGALHVATACMEAYTAFWRVRPKPVVLAVEHELKARALAPGAPQWAWRGARLDSIERTPDGLVWIGEAKTTSSLAGRVRQRYALHGQTLLQMALWGPEEEKRFGKLGGILLDVVVKPSGRKGAQPQPRQKLGVAEVRHALSTWFPRDVMRWIREQSGMTWNSEAERRVTQCTGGDGPCPFRSMCSKGKPGATMFQFADGTPIARWKPSKGKEVPPWE